MHQISVPYSAGGSQALGVASAEQRLLAAMLREPSYIPQVRAQLSPEKFVLPQQKELYEAFLQCQEQGIEISLSTLRPFVSEEALNELSRLAAQYSDVTVRRTISGCIWTALPGAPPWQARRPKCPMMI